MQSSLTWNTAELRARTEHVEESGHVYGGTPRTQSSGSSSASPPAAPHGAGPQSSGSAPSSTSASMLIVPHPLGLPTKTEDVHHVVTQNGSGRKYQCKMCPSYNFIN
ncbi:unnamed protein product [Nesidiocoris tenuis]|uniref:Uncharacterized protein n=1 Tax=Nesidiocoris tenuis TaxID=355587 RepID=A0A6H5HQ53_9HEMI|nr:unnamed protein product [Nesidiocoris tenuis]